MEPGGGCHPRCLLLIGFTGLFSSFQECWETFPQAAGCLPPPTPEEPGSDQVSRILIDALAD